MFLRKDCKPYGLLLTSSEDDFVYDSLDTAAASQKSAGNSHWGILEHYLVRISYSIFVPCYILVYCHIILDGFTPNWCIFCSLYFTTLLHDLPCFCTVWCFDLLGSGCCHIFSIFVGFQWFHQNSSILYALFMWLCFDLYYEHILKGLFLSPLHPRLCYTITLFIYIKNSG